MIHGCPDCAPSMPCVKHEPCGHGWHFGGRCDDEASGLPSQLVPNDQSKEENNSPCVSCLALREQVQALERERAHLNDCIGELMQAVSARKSERDQAREAIKTLETWHTEEVAQLTREKAELLEHTRKTVDFHRDMAARLAEDRDVLKHRNRTLDASTLHSQQMREALEANVVEIRQQSGRHYDGCNCTFCNVISRSEQALAALTGEAQPPKS